MKALQETQLQLLNTSNMSRLFVIFALLAYVFGAPRRLQDFSALPDILGRTLNKTVSRSTTANRIFTNFCPTFHEGVHGKIDEASTCLHQLVLDRNETLCDALETKVPACFDGIVEFFEGCLKGEGKQVPRLVADIFRSFTRFACESTGEQLLELANPCIYGSENSEESRETSRELKEELEKLQNEDTLPSKQYICRLLLELRSDEKDNSLSQCSLDITKDTWIRFLDSLVVPCQDNSENQV